jgi:MoxR-like ATPase
MDASELAQRVAQGRPRLDPLLAAVGRVVVGQRGLLERLLIGLLADGHLLLEGVPGLAKTLAVRTLASALALSAKRIQFTPDLLPADVVGTQIYQPRTGEFTIKPGPIFAHLILADEINRAPAKVQSALLEAMQERQVTLGEQTLPLPQPFLVLATQNPLEQEGTYPLPEAQLDRFLLKVVLTYPSVDEEVAILERHGTTQPLPTIAPVLTGTDVIELRQLVDALHVDPKLTRYVVDLIHATRRPADYGVPLAGYLQVGVGPRGSLALLRAARAQAFLAGRHYVVPQDVKDVAPDVLRHRFLLSYQAEGEGLTADELIRRLLAALPVP